MLANIATMLYDGRVRKLFLVLVLFILLFLGVPLQVFARSCNLTPQNPPPTTADTLTLTTVSTPLPSSTNYPNNNFDFVIVDTTTKQDVYTEGGRTGANGFYQKQFPAPTTPGSYKVLLRNKTNPGENICDINFSIVSPAPNASTPTPIITITPTPTIAITPTPTTAPANCPICDMGYLWTNGRCYDSKNNVYKNPVYYQDCSAGSNQCFPGCGCNQNVCLNVPPPSVPPALLPCAAGCTKDGKTCFSVDQIKEKPALKAEIAKCTKIDSAIGPIETDPTAFIKTIFTVLLSMASGWATYLIITAGYQLMFSGHEAEKVQEARDKITSAIVGLVFMILSLIVLKIIGVDIFQLPSFVR